MRKITLFSILILGLLCGCGGTAQPKATIDPYAGLVQVESGYGTKIWVREYENVAVNPLRNVDLAAGGRIIDENGVAYSASYGIDVSEHQGSIDWTLLAEDAPDFAIIRAGYRGYGEAGRLCTDAFFHENLEGALNCGIPVGLYFFSQAVTPEEAEEEAEYVLHLLADYAPARIELPIFFDWEDIGFEEARTDGTDGETLTRCAAAFCRRLEAAGYAAGIYTYRSLAYFHYDLSQLNEFPLWIGALGTCPDYYYRFSIWQCSAEGALAGIEGDVDVDVIFTPMPADTTDGGSASES